MKKRNVLVLLFVFVIFVLLTSCADNTTSTEDDSTLTPGSSGTTSSKTSESSKESASAETKDISITYPLKGENLKLTYWIPLRQAMYEDHLDKNICWQAIQENTGVDIEFIHPSPEKVTEQLTLLIAGGDLPDLIQVDNRYDSNGGPAGGVEEGIFVDLTDYLEENAPDYLKAVYSNELCWRMLTDSEGRISYFAQIKADAPEYQRFTFRKDMMEEIGWGEKVPVTIDDYTKLCRDFKEAGYYATTLTSNGKVDQFMWAYGVSRGFYLEDDGTVTYGPINDGFKEYLKLMNEWYENGYVHPDFTGNIDAEALFNSKQLGIRYGSVDTATSNANKNGFEILVANYPRLYEGQEITHQIVTYEPKPADGIRTVISTKCKNVELACQFLNYGYTQEGADIYNFGIEGISYTVNADGVKEFNKDLFLNHPEGWSPSICSYIYKLHFGPKLAEPDVICGAPILLNPNGLKNRTMYSDDTTVNGKSVIRAQLNGKQTSARASIMSQIESYVNEMVLQFITGKADIETEWEKYVSTVKSMGIDEAIAITQEAVDQYNKKEFPGVR